MKPVTLWALTAILSLGSLSYAYLTPHEYYDAQRHFLMNSSDTKWDFFNSDDVTSHTTNSDQTLQFVARSPHIIANRLQPTLTLRIDHGKWATARAYGERWLKDFPKFGYEIEMSRDSKMGSLQGFEMELASKKTSRTVRQFITKNKDEIFVFTCTSDAEHFSVSWSACERILKTAQLR